MVDDLSGDPVEGLDLGRAAVDGVLVGAAADIVGWLREFVDLGFGGLNLMPAGDDVLRQIRLLGEDVLPALRA